MTARSLLAAALLALAVFAPAAARAHTMSESHSAWRVQGKSIRLIFTLPELEAKRLAKDSEETATDAEIAGYLAPKVYASVEDQACPAPREPRAVAAAPGYRRFEFQFECPTADGITLHSEAFLDLVPTHVNFAQIETGDGKFTEQLLTTDRKDLPVGGESAESPLQNAGFFEYIRLGIMHIFTGPDHQSFLLGLVLISKRLRDLVFVITGFTLGHSVTLALTVTGVLRPHAEYIDALIGLTIALIAAENISLASGRPRVVAAAAGGLLIAMAFGGLLGFGGLPVPLTLGAGIFAASYVMFSSELADAGRFRLLVTLIFGLIHGFGFASDLLEMKLPTGRLAELLVGFNLGVEIGQLTLVFAALGFVYLLKRLRWTLPRDIVTDFGAAALAGIGLFWFASRAYS